MKKIVVSGGFDPLHIGHIRMFNNAKKLGDHLTIILNSDRFLMKKKGFIFMPYKERKEVILSLGVVDRVIKSIDKDHTVCETIKKLSKKNEIDVFANGGDRKNINDIPENIICKKNKIEMIFEIGGDKIQSSSDLTKKFQNYTEKRPWGSFENLKKEKGYLVKKISIQPDQKISLQLHNNRSEYWVVVRGKGEITIDKAQKKCSKGSSFFIKKQQLHRIENIGKSPLDLIEVQLGNHISEEDIKRFDDIYGR